MTDGPDKYRRLPGKKRGFLGNSSLWLGHSHLLAVSGRFFSEEYKRFYYEDIQAVIAHKTVLHLIYNVIYGLVIGLFIFLAYLTKDPSGYLILGFIAAWFFFFMSRNIWLGPTCLTRIQTAVQLELLPSLNRLSQVNKVLNILRPLLEQAQGRLRPEEMISALSGVNVAAPGPTRPLRHESGAYHKQAFIILGLNGLAWGLNLEIDSPILYILGNTTILFGAIAVIIAVVSQQDSDIPPAVKKLTWSGLVYVGLTFLIQTAFYLYASIKIPNAAGNYWELVKFMAAIPSRSGPWLSGLQIFLICIAFGLAAPGLILVFRHQSARPEPQTTAARPQQVRPPTLSR
ncbi:MAG: hypothetical protein V1742_06650 [Pseudomonadota bacterium]